MTFAAEIASLELSIQECIEDRDATYLNFDLTEAEVMEDVAYYDNFIEQARERIRALRLWL